MNQLVKREIFAADFRDRVVHHYIYNHLSPLFEKVFINDCYSCRKGKGTHYGIKRIDHFIRSCSKNYSRDCHILKLDIKGYFMSINRNILYEKVILYNSTKIDFDIQLVTTLIKQTIFNDPTQNCKVKGLKKDWSGLPKSKSLFYAKHNCGLPIGNLTSQLFGNVYLNEFDHWVKKFLGIKYYGRYVDDFILIHEDKSYLQSLIEPIATYLDNELNLQLHPNKIYLQHYSKGVKYLGAVIKPHRIYIANRTKGQFYESIRRQNQVIRTSSLDIELKQKFISSINSYLGITRHYRTYKIRRGMILEIMDKQWWKHAYFFGGFLKARLKRNSVSKYESI
ncbi:MAG: hypothetical protein DRJ29_14415 [Bacteroidetes bacterium]|nr:MAG: hypothetical protein DRH21_07350 [Deltaproteobacteria bacterium]RLD91204.1 MAG: hypothetical protein DRJ29_14415 [Bacteroidota bacterium]